MPQAPKPTPESEVARLYEKAESEAASAAEAMVGREGFAVALAKMAENVAALTKLGGDAMDLMLRNLRVAGRRDVVRLSSQLARNEDKLERVLQEVEALRDELKPAPGARPNGNEPAASAKKTAS